MLDSSVVVIVAGVVIVVTAVVATALRCQPTGERVFLKFSEISITYADLAELLLETALVLCASGSELGRHSI